MSDFKHPLAMIALLVVAVGVTGLPSLASAQMCSDAVQNGLETDIDCGGPECSGCLTGEACFLNSDCASSVCGLGGTCNAPTCSDGVQNGDEDGVDCGGMSCVACPAAVPALSDQGLVMATLMLVLAGIGVLSITRRRARTP